MNAIGTELNDAYIIESKLFQDDRGFLWNPLIYNNFKTLFSIL